MKYLFSLLIAFPFFCIGQKVTISGYVRDAETGENLIGATIYDLNSKSGTVTNAYGFYSITLDEDSVTLRVSFVGYNATQERRTLGGNVELNFELTPGEILDEVVITAEESIEALPQMSTITVPMDQLKQVPVLLGEVDVLKAIQLLPGIQGGNEGTSGIYVRGGGPDQNLILIDGVPVYNASHLFGFFSVFNADAINNVSVTKGGFPARYGGRLSSVVDISMKEGNNQKITGKGTIGLISSKFTIEGPIKNENTSFIFSARRTYIDLLTRPLIKASTDGEVIAGYFFEDLNAKINHRFSNKDRLYLSFYGGKDKFYSRDRYDQFFDDVSTEYDDEAGIKWGNVITAVRWNHLFSPKLFSNVTGTFSRYQFDVFSKFQTKRTGPGVNEEELEEIEYNSGIKDFAIKVDFDYLPIPQHNFKFGVMGIRHAFTPGVFAFRSDTEADTTFGANKTLATEFSAYVEDDFSIGSQLRFNFGVHAARFEVRGKDFYSVQPRLTGRYLLNSNTSLKASYSEMRQFVQLLANSGIGLPTDLWVPATDQLEPQESWQVALGAARTIGPFEVSVETYYKEMKNLIEYVDGATYFNTDDNWEEKVTSGDGDSYGAELLVQRKTGKLSGWVGYTWSKTTRQFDALNFGERYPYRYDRRHDVSVVSVYQLNDRVKLSGTWVYGTGNAVSLPESQFPRFENRFRQVNPFRNGGELDFYPSRNNFRMRAYHRLDFGVTMTKQKPRGLRTWALGVYNIYSRRNPFYIDVAYDNRGNKKFVQYSLFPFLPYVSYSFEF